MRVPVRSVSDDDLTFYNGDRSNFSLEEVNMLQHLTNGIDDMGQIEIARRYFMKHRCKQEEIVLVNERDFEIGIAAFFELKCGVDAAEPTAENENTFHFHMLALDFRSWLAIRRSTRHAV